VLLHEVPHAHDLVLDARSRALYFVADNCCLHHGVSLLLALTLQLVQLICDTRFSPLPASKETVFCLFFRNDVKLGEKELLFLFGTPDCTLIGQVLLAIQLIVSVFTLFESKQPLNVEVVCPKTVARTRSVKYTFI